LELLDLPRASPVGFVTGATAANFVCLAAARVSELSLCRRQVMGLVAQGLSNKDIELSWRRVVASRWRLSYATARDIRNARICFGRSVVGWLRPPTSVESSPSACCAAEKFNFSQSCVGAQ
jgi:hypothetical protein